ncbi:hypothetical protein [Streptomyces pseudogriseolus]|uniref:hypothetical protein n=1 Tax=Streptomyces pseudogriseolus TaxID=36817 RepID=UPI003656BF3E
MPRHAGGRARTSRRARATALAGVAAACVIALPLAAACAGRDDGRRHTPSGPDDLRPVLAPERRASPSPWDGDAPAGDGSLDGTAPARTPEADQAPPGAHLSTALRCGPSLSSPDGVEAQTCVAVQGKDVWARTYYRNATGAPLDAALSLLGLDGHSVRSRCVAGSGDDPSLCETPRVRLDGEPVRYTAMAEFAAHAGGAGDGGLLLRAGSNALPGKGNSPSGEGNSPLREAR